MCLVFGTQFAQLNMGDHMASSGFAPQAKCSPEVSDFFDRRSGFHSNTCYNSKLKQYAEFSLRLSAPRR
jgi:hypothetical protein